MAETILWKGKGHFCNTEVLISRMNWYTKCNTRSNFSLSPDHDMQIQIEETMSSMKFACKRTQLEGSQYTSNKEIRKLPSGKHNLTSKPIRHQSPEAMQKKEGTRGQLND
eukprot:scaffold325661_cov40-Attheya_sp.AAC.3